jgi:trimeric autotransporter adhesin
VAISKIYLSLLQMLTMKRALICLSLLIPFLSHGQMITTVAGTGFPGYTGDSVLATTAKLTNPYGIFLDSAGNCFIADAGNNVVRKIDTLGVITTLAGNGYGAGLGYGGYNGDGGLATAAELSNPVAVAVDDTGNVYIADQANYLIRKIDTSHHITTIAGNTAGGYYGDGGPATAAELSYPSGVAIDYIGNIYIADRNNNRIRIIDTTHTIYTYAGTGLGGYTNDNGPATVASLNSPVGIAVDGNRFLYIADQSNNRIRMIDTFGIITTIAGIGTANFSGDGGPATAAELNKPTGVAVDFWGDVYIADNGNMRIRMINTQGIITTIAGNGTLGLSGDGGPALSAELHNPSGVAANNYGVWLADNGNDRIRRVFRSVSAVPNVIAASGNITIYPDPTTGDFTVTISAPDDEPLQLQLFDVTGRKCQELQSKTNVQTVMHTTLPPGIYIVSTSSAHTRFTRKVTIQ